MVTLAQHQVNLPQRLTLESTRDLIDAVVDSDAKRPPPPSKSTISSHRSANSMKSSS